MSTEAGRQQIALLRALYDKQDLMLDALVRLNGRLEDLSTALQWPGRVQLNSAEPSVCVTSDSPSLTNEPQGRELACRIVSGS
jgi:hypothetical protein